MALDPHAQSSADWLPPQADALAGSDWRALRAVGSAASCGVNAIPAALEAMLVKDAGFPGEVLRERRGYDAWE
jgi:hypothetical protein